MRAAEVFAGLSGAWCFERNIQDARSRAWPCMRAAGSAQFVAGVGDDACWMYEEHGNIVSAAQRVALSQSYRYVLDARTGGIRVYFARGENRGRHFHDIMLTHGPDGSDDVVVGWGQHGCGRDQYSADYLFTFDKHMLVSLCVIYTARGPHKDYVSRTAFSRMHDMLDARQR